MKEKSCGAIVIHDKKVLMIKSINGPYGFPKGHMEKGETEEQTAIREVKEETNIDISVDSSKRYSISYYVKKNILKDVIYFIGEPLTFDSKPQISEIDEVVWVDIDKVEDMLEFDNIKKLWNQIIQNHDIID